MFDDEELEQIREEQEEWQGHVDRQTVKRSRTSKKVLFGSVTASFVMSGFILFLVASGMISSALIGAAGIGGFNAQIEQLNGTDIAIYPALGPTAACSSSIDFNQGGPAQGNTVETLPQLRGEIGGANVPQNKNLTLTKDVRTPNVLGIELVRLDLTASNDQGKLNLENATLYLTGLNASRLKLNDAQIREFYSNGSSSSPRFFEGVISNRNSVLYDNAAPGEFAIQNAQDGQAQARIINASARAHFVAFDTLDIRNVELKLQYFNSSNAPSDAVTADDNCPEP